MEKKVITYYDYENHFIHEINVTHLSEKELRELKKFYEIIIYVYNLPNE